MRPGCFIRAMDNGGDYRLTHRGDVWNRIGLGLWRRVDVLPMDRKKFYSLAGWDKGAPNGWRCGLLFRWESAWLGVHYSPYNRRFCINLIPFVTIWITLRGGKVP